MKLKESETQRKRLSKENMDHRDKERELRARIAVLEGQMTFDKHFELVTETYEKFRLASIAAMADGILVAIGDDSNALYMNDHGPLILQKFYPQVEF